MGESFNFEDVTNSVLNQQSKNLDRLNNIVSNEESGSGVGIPEENIGEIRKLIKILLDGATKMMITNKNQRKNQYDPIFVLMVNSKGFRLIVTRNMKKFDYVFEIEKNNLLLNNFPASEIDADRFQQFFNRIISRMVDDQYEVTKDV